MLRKLLTSIATATALLAFAAPGSALGANSLGAQMFGFSPGGALQNEDATTLARDLDTMQSAGSKWLRVDINWAQIQAGGPGSYNWSAIDRVVEGATSRGMNVLGVIVYTPNWARPSGTSATYGPDPATYAAFAATAAQHYSALGVHAFEVWNEPNTPAFWTPAPNPAHYTRLLQAAYPAIKAADPSATVLSGGTAPAPSDGTSYSPVDFLKRIYANGGGGFFDAVSHHPYCWPAAPGEAQAWSAWYQMYGTSPSIRSTMVANGDGGKKIWATEFGAPTDGPSGSHVTESQQAATITKGYAEWQTYNWAGPLFSYEGRDYGTTKDSRENFFGLLRYDFSPKPAYAAYKAAARAGGSVDPPVDPPPVDPPPVNPPPVVDAPTDIIVKGKGHQGKGGKVKGRVLAKRVQGASSAELGGRVQLKLYRRAAGTWRSASRIRMAKLSSRGRFGQRLGALRRGKLNPGVYLVRARYPGSHSTRPSNSRSRRFKVRA